MAVAAAQAAQLVGRPEGDLALIHAAAYLARAPKSNALVVNVCTWRCGVMGIGGI